MQFCLSTDGAIAFRYLYAFSPQRRWICRVLKGENAIERADQFTCQIQRLSSPPTNSIADEPCTKILTPSPCWSAIKRLRGNWHVFAKARSFTRILSGVTPCCQSDLTYSRSNLTLSKIADFVEVWQRLLLPLWEPEVLEVQMHKPAPHWVFQQSIRFQTAKPLGAPITLK